MTPRKGGGKEKYIKRPAGNSFRRGVYPRGRAFGLITPPYRAEGIQKGPLFIRWQEVRFRGKGSKNGLGSSDTAGKAV